MVQKGRAAVHGGRDARARRRSALKRSAGEVYRRAILEAAERLFQRSFIDAKMADIAREAGMATGSLYNYFDSKERIFQSLVELRGDELLARVEAVFRRGDAPRATLEAVVETGLRFMEEHRAMHDIFVQLGAKAEWSIRRIGGECAEQRYDRYLRLYERAIRSLADAGALRADIPTADLVPALTGMINGHVRVWMKSRRKRGLAKKAPRIVDLFLSGAGVQ